MTPDSISSTNQFHFNVYSLKTGAAISHVIDDGTGVLPPVTFTSVAASTPAKARKQKAKVAQIVALCVLTAAQYPGERFDVYIHNMDIRQLLVSNKDGCRHRMPEGFTVLSGPDGFRKKRGRMALARASESAQTTAAAVRRIPVASTLLTGVDNTVQVNLEQSNSVPASNELVVATDASVNRDAPHRNGYAWLASDGTFGIGPAKHTDTNVCELYAILNMLNNVPRTENMRILVDSQVALQTIKFGTSEISKLPPVAGEIAEQIRAKLNGYRNVTLEWVKSHNGHPLNEGADRLARNARIAFSHNKTMKAKAHRGLQTITRNIVDEVMAAYKAQTDVPV
jgi:ribonuclease HI